MTTPASALAALSQPGGIFELQDWRDGERTGKSWKNGPQTLADIFAATRAHGAKPFLVCGYDEVSYEAFRAASDRFGALFLSLGIARGDVVALALRHEPEWIAAFFALARIGAIAAAMNPAADTDELELLIELSHPVALVCDERVAGRADDGFFFERGIKYLLVARTEGGQSRDGASVRIGLGEAIGDVETWRERATWEGQPALPIVAVDADAPAFILFTSGTTGRPKAVLLSHRCCAYSVFHAAYRNARAALVAGAGPSPAVREALLLVLPLFHASGSCDALLPLMVRGGLVVTMAFWSPVRACNLIRQHEITIAAMVPSVTEQLLRHPDFSGAKASLRQIFYGGAPPSPDLPRQVAEAGVTPGQNWGMTETGGAVVGHVGTEYRSRPGSCGRPAPILELRVVSPDGNVLPPGEIGELQVKGPQVMKGYWGDEALTAEFIRDGWLRTGDLARLDDEGYCFIVDRAKDMIITSGENIYCSEIELALLAHPDIEDAAVIGAPHALVGERPLAFVVLKDGVKAPSEADVRIFVGDRLAPAKVPTAIVYRSGALPRNAMGKIEKAKLRLELLADRV